VNNKSLKQILIISDIPKKKLIINFNDNINFFKLNHSNDIKKIKLTKKIKDFYKIFFIFSDIDYSKLTSKISKYSLCLEMVKKKYSTKKITFLDLENLRLNKNNLVYSKLKKKIFTEMVDAYKNMFSLNLDLKFINEKKFLYFLKNELK
tara:strand:- start:781 stop:1227 length:447 start_codon:yes stop_codon:yes gene_type:complete